MAKIRIIERNHRRRMKITLTSQREVEWLLAIFNGGHEVTNRLYDIGNLPTGSRGNWEALQLKVYRELHEALSNIER